MKKFLVALLLLVPGQSFAAGPYDGIWEITPFGYATISERDGMLIVIFTNNEEYGGNWSALQGKRINENARVSVIKGYTISMFDISFETNNILRVTQLSCVPISSDYICLFPDGIVLTANKVW